MSEHVAVSRTPISWNALQGLLVAQALLQILDLATTFLALQAGGWEANPVSRGIIEGPGWLAYGAVKLALAAAFLGLWPVTRMLDGWEGRITIAGMAIFAVVMTGVVVNNALIAL